MKIQNEFDMYIDKLKETYNENPEKATKEAHDSLLRMGYFNKGKHTNDNHNKNNEIVLINSFDKIPIIICFVITTLIGLFNFSDYGAYLMGLIFFIAGVVVSIYIRGFGLIFLFSHGMSGYGIMIGSLLSPVLNHPILRDNPKNILIYLSIIMTISIIGFIMNSIFNIIGHAKMNKYLIILPLIMYNIALFMAAILPKILLYVYNFKF